MKAEILAVGTELLLGDILNTNAQFLAQELANLGIEVYYQTVVGDNPQRLKDTIFHAFSRADLIITTGGLGPTEDDLTKETAAEYFGERLILDERALGRIRKYFDRTGRVMTENNVKQAMVPEKNGIVLYNDNGTAPVIIMEKIGKMIVMLPGPPRETIPMFHKQEKPYLAKKQEFTFVSRILRVAEVGESAMEERVKDIIDAQTNPTIAPYAKDGEAILRITAKARDEEEANRLIDPVAAVLKERLGDAVYGEGETDLETVVAEQLLQKQLTLAVAESCTGGMIASNLVEYPGISAALVEGCVTYSNEAKMHRLGVKAETLEKYGADAIRWYFYINSAPWLPNRFHGKAVVEGQRKFMGTLWNTYAFFVLYANIDDFDATKYTLDYDKLSVMDKWLLSKLNSAIKAVDYDLSNYKIPEAAKALQSFVDDMSNWYVRRSRERFWAKGMEQDKINAYMTLYTALVEICKTAAPMIPFMTEDIYQNLVRSVDESAPESIHLRDFPVVNEAHIDTELEANMDNVLKLVVMGRACRNTANIKNRQPIGQMYVKADFEIPEFYKDIVKDELNVKNVTFTQDVRDFTSYTFKPQLKTVGPKYGKMLGGIKAALENLEGNAAMDELNATDALKLDINGQEVTLFREDLLIESAQMPGYVSENDNGITVVMDTNLSEELLEEGFVREIISKVQTMRKEAGFEVMDKIAVTYEGTEKAEKVFADNASTIADETLALEVTKAAPAGYTKEWKINGETVTIGVEKR